MLLVRHRVGLVPFFLKGQGPVPQIGAEPSIPLLEASLLAGILPTWNAKDKAVLVKNMRDAIQRVLVKHPQLKPDVADEGEEVGGAPSWPCRTLSRP